MATQSILSRTNAEVLKAHMNCCVRQAVEAGDAREAEAKLEELSAVLEKLVKK